MIAAAMTIIGTVAITALLCAAVDDPAQTANMSLKQRARFCLRP
jgi:hypothetical protein